MKIIPIRNQNDWEQIREICCLTGNSGNPIARERWPFFAETWVTPYQSLLPGWTWISVEGSDTQKVIGYLSGCPVTDHFESRKWLRNTLPLFLLSPFYKKNGDIERFRKRFLRQDRTPEQCFSKKTNQLLQDLYPAHLHMNFREEARGQGLGLKIARIFLEALRSKKIQGCHVYCGPVPLPFYLRLGFQELEKIEFRPGVWVYCLGIQL